MDTEKSDQIEDPEETWLKNQITFFKRYRKIDLILAIVCFLVAVLSAIFGMTPAQQVFAPAIFALFCFILLSMAWGEHKKVGRYWEELERYKHDHIQRRIEAKGE